jgi:hypothetical protein
MTRSSNTLYFLVTFTPSGRNMSTVDLISEHDDYMTSNPTGSTLVLDHFGAMILAIEPSRLPTTGQRHTEFCKSNTTGGCLTRQN